MQGNMLRSMKWIGWLTSIVLGRFESVVPNVHVLLKKVMNMKSKHSNMHYLFKTTSLLDLYHKVVKALLNLPEDAHRFNFSRDYDWQLFKMLLGETSADTDMASLTMSDLLLPDQCRPTNDGGSLLSVRLQHASAHDGINILVQ